MCLCNWSYQALPVRAKMSMKEPSPIWQHEVSKSIIGSIISTSLLFGPAVFPVEPAHAADAMVLKS